MPGRSIPGSVRKLDHACRDGRAGVPGAHDRVRLTALHQIDSAAD